MERIRKLSVSRLPSRSLDPVEIGCLLLYPDGKWACEVTDAGDGKAVNAAFLKFLTKTPWSTEMGGDEYVTAEDNPDEWFAAVQVNFSRSSTTFLSETSEDSPPPKQGKLKSFLNRIMGK